MKNEWESKIEASIRKALKGGDTSALPGAGKPLELDSDPHTPDDMRIAYKLLRDNGYQPEWIMHGQELDGKRRQLVQRVEKGLRAYRGALGDAERKHDASQRARVEKTWETARRAFTEASEQFNRAVLSYNLKVPHGIAHKQFFDLEREIKRLLG